MKIYDKITLVLRDSDSMAYLVNPDDENMLASARKWATRYNHKSSEYTISNGNLELTIVNSADTSCQGGKLSFWTCELHDEESGLTFKIAISAYSLCELIKNNTFNKGKCKNKVFLVKSTASARVVTTNMEEYKGAKIVKSDTVRLKRQTTDDWKLGKVYETNTGKNPLLVIGYAIDACSSFDAYNFGNRVKVNSPSLNVVTLTGKQYNNEHSTDRVIPAEYNFYRNTERICYEIGTIHYIVIDLEKNGLSIDDVKDKTLIEIAKAAESIDILKSKKRVEIDINSSDLFNNDVTYELHKKLMNNQRKTYKEICENNEYTLDRLREILYRVSIADVESFGADNIKEIVLNDERQTWIDEFKTHYNSLDAKMQLHIVTFDNYRKLEEDLGRKWDETQKEYSRLMNK